MYVINKVHCTKLFNTLVVDGIHGNSEIANVFKSKFSALYSSVPTTTEAMEFWSSDVCLIGRSVY